MKAIRVLALLPVLLSACTTLNSAPHSATTPPSAPTVVSLSTISPTATPVPPTDFAYTISVLDPNQRMLHVHLVISNLQESTPVLTLWTNAGTWYSWMDPWANVENLQAANDSGYALVVEKSEDGIPWTTQGVSIATRAERSIQVDYDVKLGFKDQSFSGDAPQFLGGYMNKRFAIAEPEFLLLAPHDVERNSNYTMQVRFELPEGWVSITPWRAIAPDSYTLTIGDKSFGYGAIALGRLVLEERKLGETAIRVGVYGMSEGEAKRFAENALGLYQYYDDTFGHCAIPAFDLIFIPERVDGVYVNPYNEQSGGFFIRSMPSYGAYWSDSIAHPIAHNWVPGGVNGDFWFMEGFVSYYELKSTEAVGILKHSTVQHQLRDRLSQYNARIVGTADDISLTQASALYNTQHDFPFDFLVYEKGSLVAYMLDLSIQESTAGSKSLDDGMSLLWSRYYGVANNHADMLAIKEAVESVTSEDFDAFFADYVSGNSTLPLVVEGGELVIKGSPEG